MFNFLGQVSVLVNIQQTLSFQGHNPISILKSPELATLVRLMSDRLQGSVTCMHPTMISFIYGNQLKIVSFLLYQYLSRYNYSCAYSIQSLKLAPSSLLELCLLRYGLPHDVTLFRLISLHGPLSQFLICLFSLSRFRFAVFLFLVYLALGQLPGQFCLIKFVCVRHEESYEMFMNLAKCSIEFKL